MSSKIIAGTTAGTALNMSADTSGQLEIQTGSTPTTAITVDTAQNVGIGTASPAAKVEITGGGNSGREVIAFNGTNATDLYTTYRYNTSTLLGYIGNGAGTITGASSSDFGIRSQNALAFATGGATERMRIDTSGNLGVGAASTGPKLYVNQATTSQYAGYFNFVSGGYGIGIKNASGGAATLAYFFSSNYVGEISTNGSTTSYSSASDYRLKDNVSPMTGALAKVSVLKPVTYTWKADGSEGQGFIAHELAEICPDAVTGKKDEVNEDGTIKAQSVDTSFLVATLTAAIQEQQTMIEELKTKVAALEAK